MEKLALSEEDRGTILGLIGDGVLEDICPDRLDQKSGVILFACPDGHQMPDLFSHQVRIQESESPMVHPCGFHGGAPRLLPNSPLNRQPFEADVFFLELADAVAVKGVKTIILYTHAPCGKAKLLPFPKIIALQLEARELVISKFRDKGVEVAVTCFTHIDFGDDKKRTYHVDRGAWREHFHQYFSK